MEYGKNGVVSMMYGFIGSCICNLVNKLNEPILEKLMSLYCDSCKFLFLKDWQKDTF